MDFLFLLDFRRILAASENPLGKSKLNGRADLAAADGVLSTTLSRNLLKSIPEHNESEDLNVTR